MKRIKNLYSKYPSPFWMMGFVLGFWIFGITTLWQSIVFFGLWIVSYVATSLFLCRRRKIRWNKNKFQKYGWDVETNDSEFKIHKSF